MNTEAATCATCGDHIWLTIGGEWRHKRAGMNHPVSPTFAAKTYVRHNARETEKVAAKRAIPRASTDKARILELLSAGPQTTDEISVQMGKFGRPDRPNQYAARILDLVESGWVEDTGEHKRTRTGSPATVWRIIE